jgi:hypothetical protein
MHGVTTARTANRLTLAVSLRSENEYEHDLFLGDHLVGKATLQAPAQRSFALPEPCLRAGLTGAKHVRRRDVKTVS